MDKDIFRQPLILGLLFTGLIVAAVFLLPWRLVHWGNVAIRSSQSVTVVGTAKTEEQNQIATFTAGINAVKDNKDAAVTEVNTKLQTIVAEVQKLGIPAADIKSQNLNIYQNEEQYYEDGRQKTRLGQWRVSNSVEIKLRDLSKADQLAQVLTGSGANNVYGPNFMLDDTNEAEKELLSKAIEQAREKAELVAKAANKKVGDIIAVQEGTSTNMFKPVYNEGGGGGGGGMMPGTGTVQKDVTVTFELR